MRDACRDSQLCYNLDRLSVTVSEDEIRQRDAAAGEYPVHRGNGETHVPVFSNILLFFFSTQSCIICSYTDMVS